MKRYFVFLVSLLTVFSTEAFAQFNLYPSCNAGLHPDGFVDFSGLPLAPNFPGPAAGLTTGPSTPFTATLSVQGVSGLTVEVTIPSLKSISGGPGPIYQITNGALVLNGYPLEGQLISFQFGGAIAGIGVIANSLSRDTSYVLLIDAPPTGETPPNFQNASSTDVLGYHYLSTPLMAVVSSGGSFQSASINYVGDDSTNPSLANLRVQSSAASYINLVPKDGLEQWLMSESAGTPFLGTATSWPDQSGQNHDAIQTTAAYQPARVEADGNTCFGAYSFSGSQYFDFDLPIDGWQEMTIFMVAKASVNPAAGSRPSQASAIFWNENAPEGSTFLTPYQNDVSFSFGTTQGSNEEVFVRPLPIGQDFTITRAVHNGANDALYIDGLLALTKPNKLPVLSGTRGKAYIGRGSHGSYFNGEIAEILVYDRVLLPEEAAGVEFYLRTKFGTR
jgi:hypothetical protein